MSFYQVHFAPVPGATKKHYRAIQPAITERLHEMIRRGQLLMAGRYAETVGGEWLLRAKNKHEVERMAMDNPAVKCNLVTYKIREIVDVLGPLTREAMAQTEES
jgi:uncharacterized protein YciI